MSIEIIDEQDVIVVTDELQDIITNCIDAVLAYLNIDFQCELGITLVDNHTIKALNRKFRGVDTETDVLSFPILDFKGNLDDLTLEDLEYDMNPETGSVMLGDIVISLERTQEQAKEYGHSFYRELGFLTVHGMLHLLGYDHQDDAERQEMRNIEEEVLESLDLVRH